MEKVVRSCNGCGIIAYYEIHETNCRFCKKPLRFCIDEINDAIKRLEEVRDAQKKAPGKI
jgi:hypothetical protein